MAETVHFEELYISKVNKMVLVLRELECSIFVNYFERHSLQFLVADAHVHSAAAHEHRLCTRLIYMFLVILVCSLMLHTNTDIIHS